MVTIYSDSAELEFLREEIGSKTGPASLAILACVSKHSVLETLKYEYGSGEAQQWNWVLGLLGLNQLGEHSHHHF